MSLSRYYSSSYKNIFHIFSVMRQAITIILGLFISAGTIFSPLGNFSCVDYVPEMYELCVAEDEEITATDFFFEHLLNLESVADFLEQDMDDVDEPYAPIELPQPVVQTQVVIQQPLDVSFRFYTEVVMFSYTLYQSPFKLSGHSTEVFHPPTI